jgi:hypothetical protein
MSPRIHHKHERCSELNTGHDCTLSILLGANLDFVLCGSAYFPGGFNILVLLHVAAYETYSRCRSGSQSHWCESLDREYFYLGSESLWNSLGCHFHRYHHVIALLTGDWFGYLGIVVLIRLSPLVNKKLSKVLKKKFAYYPGTSNFWRDANWKRSISSTMSIE